jgi:hypothetical protein
MTDMSLNLTRNTLCCPKTVHSRSFEDVDPALKSRREYHAVVMLIPPLRKGPRTFKEPSVLDGYLLPLLWDLQRYGPPVPNGVANRLPGPERLGLPVAQLGARMHNAVPVA